MSWATDTKTHKSSHSPEAPEFVLGSSSPLQLPWMFTIGERWHVSYACMQNLQTVIVTHYPFDFGISARLTLDPDALQVREGRDSETPSIRCCLLDGVGFSWNLWGKLMDKCYVHWRVELIIHDPDISGQLFHKSVNGDTVDPWIQPFLKSTF